MKRESRRRRRKQRVLAFLEANGYKVWQHNGQWLCQPSKEKVAAVREQLRAAGSKRALQVLHYLDVALKTGTSHWLRDQIFISGQNQARIEWLNGNGQYFSWRRLDEFRRQFEASRKPFSFVDTAYFC